MNRVKRKNLRIIYYSGSIILLILSAVLMTIPIYSSINSELGRKVHQLEEAIIDQKRLLIKTIVVEKISDIQNLHNRLRSSDYTREETDLLFRSEVRDLIYGTTLPDDGYIWINEILDYRGGDDYALRFLHPNLRETEGMLLSTAMTDIAGNSPYQEELEGIREKGEVFLEYYFKEPGSASVSHKLSYARLYEPYDWVVATGVYMNDIDLLIEEDQREMQSTSRRTMRGIVLIYSIVLIFLITLEVYFEINIQRFIGRHLQTLHQYNDLLRQEKEKLKTAYEKIETLAYTDYLTELWNRRAMMDRLRQEHARIKRNKGSLGLIMCDMDRFKGINDGYGHDMGDLVLRHVSDVLRSHLRAEDSLARWGGEEFLAMVIDADERQTHQAAEKLRVSVEERPFLHEDIEIPLSITLGYAVLSPEDEIDTVINRADQKLYVGKREGRNRVIG